MNGSHSLSWENEMFLSEWMNEQMNEWDNRMNIKEREEENPYRGAIVSKWPWDVCYTSPIIQNWTEPIGVGLFACVYYNLQIVIREKSRSLPSKNSVCAHVHVSVSSFSQCLLSAVKCQGTQDK